MASSSKANKEQSFSTQYSRQLRDSIKSLLDNFSEIMSISAVNKDEKVTQAQVEHKSSEIKIRAANMVRASEALSKLVTDIQEFLVLNDFSSINATISQQTTELQGLIDERENTIASQYKSLQQEASDTAEPMDSH